MAEELHNKLKTPQNPDISSPYKVVMVYITLHYMYLTDAFVQRDLYIANNYLFTLPTDTDSISTLFKS